MAKRNAPSPVLVAKVLSDEFRLTKRGTKWQYAEIDFPMPDGWELNKTWRPGGGSSASVWVRDGKIVLELRRMHERAIELEKTAPVRKQKRLERARKRWAERMESDGPCKCPTASRALRVMRHEDECLGLLCTVCGHPVKEEKKT